VGRYQKAKTNLDFTEARDSEWQWHQMGRMQVCTSLQTDNHASTSPLSFFTGRMPFLPPNQQRQSTEGTIMTDEIRQFQQVCLETHPSALNMTLPAFAATAPTAIDRYLLQTLLLNNKPAGYCCRPIGQTDGRTPDRYTDPVPHTVQAVSI